MKNRCAAVREAIERFGGCREEVLRALFGGSCSRELAEQLALASAHCYGLSIAQFMRAWRKWKRGEKFTLPERDDKQSPPPH
jgi:hypothetical protein